ncbi:MAG TPA: hypothetical protein VK308_14510 [Pyrinomonadaceae bacterium]|nr:hypothetical protein [Pyrinomonadaceae bacterium]
MKNIRIKVVTGKNIPLFDKAYRSFLTFVCDGSCNDNPDCDHRFFWACPGCGTQVTTNGANMKNVKKYRQGRCDTCFQKCDVNSAIELSNEQIARQEFVDNAIFQLVNELVPTHYKKNTNDDSDHSLIWNIQWISELRETVQEIIIEHLDIREPEQEDFEKDFYPFLELEG